MDCFKNLVERRDEFESGMLIIAGKIIDGGTVYWRSIVSILARNYHLSLDFNMESRPD